MEDRHIIELFFARAEGAIVALAKRFERPLYKTALNILENREDALECVNDTYLALWNAIPPANPNPLAAYVQRTGRNIALKRLREKNAQKRDSSYDLSLDELAPYLPGEDPEHIVNARAVGTAINAFLASQSKQTRILFLRRYWYGDSVKEIAQALDLRENTVTVRLSRTREKLKQYLIQEGFFYEP